MTTRAGKVVGEVLAGVEARFPGAEVTDVRKSNSAHDGAPAGEYEPVHFPEMVRELEVEAERIEIVQRNFVLNGALRVGDVAQMRRAAVFRATVRLVELIQHDENLKRAIGAARQRQLAAQKQQSESDDEAGEGA